MVSHFDASFSGDDSFRDPRGGPSITEQILHMLNLLTAIQLEAVKEVFQSQQVVVLFRAVRLPVHSLLALVTDANERLPSPQPAAAPVGNLWPLALVSRVSAFVEA